MVSVFILDFFLGGANTELISLANVGKAKANIATLESLLAPAPRTLDAANTCPRALADSM